VSIPLLKGRADRPGGKGDPRIRKHLDEILGGGSRYSFRVDVLHLYPATSSIKCFYDDNERFAIPGIPVCTEFDIGCVELISFYMACSAGLASG